MSTNISNRYTDALYVEVPGQQSRNEFGDLVDTTDAKFQKWGLCREVPSGGNSLQESSEGTILKDESVLYLHKSTPAVAQNACIKVFDAAGNEVLHGVVKRYKKYKHYAKLWI